MSDVLVQELSAIEHLEALNRLFDHVWKTPEATRVSPVIFTSVTALPVRMGLALGAYTDGRLVGGWLALATAEPGAFFLVMVGVDPEVQARSIGHRLFLEARQLLLQRGVRRLYWTFDPLERTNATLYLRRLGAVGERYLPGAFGTREVAGLSFPLDRLWTRWELGEYAAPASVSRDEPPLVSDAALEARVPTLRVEVPWDYKGLLSSDPAAALAWRQRVGEWLQKALEADYRVVDFVRGEARCFHLLRLGSAVM